MQKINESTYLQEIKIKWVLQFADDRLNLCVKKMQKNLGFADERWIVQKKEVPICRWKSQGMAVSRKIGAALDSFSAWTLELQNVDYRLLR